MEEVVTDECESCPSDNLESGERDIYGLGKAEIDYLVALLNGESISINIPEETIVEKINEAFFDGFGDVIIENNGEGFEIIEDYREEINQWFKN